MLCLINIMTYTAWEKQMLHWLKRVESDDCSWLGHAIWGLATD